MTPVERPLSPHLQIYKPQLTSVLSITHRATGLALSVGILFLIWFLAAAAWSDGAFALAREFWGSWLGLFCPFGWSFSLFYHLLNGIRHLAWDSGWGFELKTAYLTGWVVVAGSIALTLVAWIAGFCLRGAS